MSIEYNEYGLTDQQEKFCQEYAMGSNLTLAAKKAGYSERSASSQASRLYKDDKIKKRINIIKKEYEERVEIDRDTIMAWLVDIAQPTSGEAAGVKLNAIKQIAQLLGYTQPEVTEINNNTFNVSNMSKEDIQKELEKYIGSNVVPLIPNQQMKL